MISNKELAKLIWEFCNDRNRMHELTPDLGLYHGIKLWEGPEESWVSITMSEDCLALYILSYRPDIGQFDGHYLKVLPTHFYEGEAQVENLLKDQSWDFI